MKQMSGKQNKYFIRSLKKGETELLKDFLYEAIFVPEGVEPPGKDIVEKPELKVYTDDFGSRKGDNCLVSGMTIYRLIQSNRWLISQVI